MSSSSFPYNPKNDNRSTDKLVKPGKKKKWIQFFIRLIISAVLILLIINAVDLDKALDYIYRINFVYFLIAFLVILSCSIPTAFSWKIILGIQKKSVSIIKLVHMNLIGFFFNTYIPSGVGGDFWKGYTMARISEKPEKGASSVIIERLVAYSATIFLGIVSFFFNFKRFKEAEMLKPISIFFGIILLILAVFILTFPYILKGGSGFLKKYLPKVPIERILNALNEYKSNVPQLLTAFIVDAISPILECVAYGFIISALNLEVPFLPLLVIVPMLRFINHIPISVSSVGTQDLALLLFWRPLGLTAAKALSISFIMHVIRLLSGAFGALLYVAFPIKRRKESGQNENSV